VQSPQPMRVTRLQEEEEEKLRMFHVYIIC